jgi:hypothetical protein
MRSTLSQGLSTFPAVWQASCCCNEYVRTDRNTSRDICMFSMFQRESTQKSTKVNALSSFLNVYVTRQHRKFLHVSICKWWSSGNTNQTLPHKTNFCTCSQHGLHFIIWHLYTVQNMLTVCVKVDYVLRSIVCFFFPDDGPFVDRNM